MSTTEERAAAVFGECRDRIDRGEEVEPDDVCRAHPDLAAVLRRRFAALRLVERAYAAVTAIDVPTALSLAGRLLGPYRLGPLLGSGGMGAVHLATVEGRAPGLAVGDRVAVKVVHPHLLSRPGFFKRFLREAEIGRTVRHENVVRTLDADQVVEAGVAHHFFVMEYVEGQTLRALLEELGRVPEQLCRHVGREIAQALAAIHAAGAVHRDVKPENVIISRCTAPGHDHVAERPGAERRESEGNVHHRCDHVVKVMDLGVARIQDEVLRLSQTGAFVGSVRYAAPEQFHGGGASADGRADLYALGLTLYELATGQHPFADDDFHAVLAKQMHEVPRPAGEVNPQISAFFEELLSQLLRKDRGERPAGAAEVARILEDGEASDWWRERAQTIRSATKRPLRRIRIPRETALYGRDADLARLRALYDAAKSGDGRAVLVEGEAGIGKTRLVDEFVSLLQRDGEDLNFLFGGNPPGGAATASGAFTTAYREQFGDRGLEATLLSYLKQTPILVPAFAALLRGEGTPEGQEPLTKDSLQTVFVHATRALAAERTTIVLIDDLHFAPEEGRALFAALAMAVPGHRVLLVGTTRPGLDEKWLANLDRLEQTSRMPLARLGAKDLARLLVDAFHSARLAEELSFKIAAKSDGNPYFVFEILRGLRDGQFIRQQPDGTWVTTRIIADIEVPSTVKDLIFARIGNLPTEERNLLDVAACAGFEFDPVLVGEVVGLAPIPALQRLAGIEKSHRLVRSAARCFVFDHHQVAEVLYAAIPEVLREHYHASIGASIEAQHGAAARDPKDLDGALCVHLAEHFLKGAAGDRALRYLDAALTHLEKGYLNEAAVRLVDRALAVSGLIGGRRRCEILLRAALRLEILGRRNGERAALDEALSLADVEGDTTLRAQARRMLGVYFRNLSQNDEAMLHLREAQVLAHAAGDRNTEAGATGSLGNIFRTLGQHALAQEHHERHLAIARATGHRGVEAMAVGNLGLVFQDVGRFAEAQEHHERHLAISREICDRRGEASAIGSLGNVCYSQGRLEEARAHLEAQLALARQIGDRRAEANATGGVGNVLQSLGQFDQAQQRFERQLVLAQELGDRQGVATVTGNLGLVLYSAGRFGDARGHHERHLALARDFGSRQAEAIAMGNLGNACWALGLLAEARGHTEAQLALTRRFEFRRSEAIALVNLGPILAELGDLSGARAAIESSLALCRAIGVQYPAGYALVRLGDIAAEEGDSMAAARHYQAGLELRRAIGHRDGVAEALQFQGALLARRGCVEEARATLREALALSRELSLRGLETLATALLAVLPGGDVAAALAALAANEGRAEVRQSMQARFLVWQATRDPAQLAEARRHLDHLVAHAPADCRGSMLANVRLHREIAAAAKEHVL